MKRPGGERSRLRGIQSHGREVCSALPGCRTALNLADLGVAKRREEEGVRRGDVIAPPDLGQESMFLDVVLQVSARTENANRGSRIRSGTFVRVHHGTASRQARVRLLGTGELSPGAGQTARLLFESPVFAFAGDRFIVRDSSGRSTLAGGCVLDPAPPELDDKQRQLLAKRAANPDCLRTFIESELARDGARELRRLLAQSPWSEQQIEALVHEMAKGGEIVLEQVIAANREWWHEMRTKAIGAIDGEHLSHPERPGIGLPELRSALSKPSERVFNAMLSSLCAAGFTVTGTYVRRTAHSPLLPPSLQAAGARIRSALSAKPLEPPPRKELSAGSGSEDAIRFLIQTGEVVELSPELVMNVSAVGRSREIIRSVIAERGPASASELREALGTNRRVIIPLLEWLDREGFTRRIGDKRVLRKAHPRPGDK